MRFVVKNQMPRFFTEGFNMPEFGLTGPAACCDNSDFPVKMDVIEGKDAFSIIAELPGIAREDVKINVEKDVLTISGERKRPADDDNKILWSERFFGTFKRSYKIDDTIDTEKITASFDHGLLKLTLPVKEEIKPKHIEVKVN